MDLDPASPTSVGPQHADYERLKAENERHQKANLLRAVLNGYGPLDEFINEAIDARDFDRVPWLVAKSATEENERLRGMLREWWTNPDNPPDGVSLLIDGTSDE